MKINVTGWKYVVARQMRRVASMAETNPITSRKNATVSKDIVPR